MLLLDIMPIGWIRTTLKQNSYNVSSMVFHFADPLLRLFANTDKAFAGRTVNSKSTQAGNDPLQGFEEIQTSNWYVLQSAHKTSALCTWSCKYKLLQVESQNAATWRTLHVSWKFGFTFLSWSLTCSFTFQSCMKWEIKSWPHST